jgi:hypothetical protein
MLGIAKYTDIKKNFEVLAVEYQKTKKPGLLAAAFVKAYPQIKDLSGRAGNFRLSIEDKASIALCQLHYSLLAFINNYEKDGRVTHKFLTLFLFRLRNELICESTKLDRKKRGSGYSEFSLEGAKEDKDFELSECLSEEADFDSFETSINLPDNLSRTEWLYCWYILTGICDEKTNNIEMGNLIGVTNARVSYIKKGLKDKLAHLVN